MLDVIYIVLNFIGLLSKWELLQPTISKYCSSVLLRMLENI